MSGRIAPEGHNPFSWSAITASRRQDSGSVRSSSIEMSAAAKLALFYLVISATWMLVSDKFVRWAVPDSGPLTLVQSFEALIFVTVSSVFLYITTRFFLDKYENSNEELVKTYDATLAGWASALDIRDQSTGQHTERVTNMAVSLAELFGIEGDELLNIRRGATLHDIGKMGVPDSLLNNKGALSDDEWALMKQHPQIAVDMLKGISYLKPALDIPYAHHEWWNGKGYPRGIAGEDIPFHARLFAVVDVYDAVTNERPYRSPMTPAEALELIKEESGTHFDPAVVAKFILLMAEKYGI